MAENKKKAARKRLGRLGALLRFALLLGLLVVGLGGGFLWALVSAYSKDLPDVEKLRSYQPSATTKIFAANGELIATLFSENRTWIGLKDVSDPMRKAIIASEDSRFYQHPGVDVVGLARAAYWIARSKTVSQGASTITMQLARGIFLNDDVTARRKIQEILVAMELERKFTKDQLLEFYLNQIYFGAGAYGVQAAAETYFGKKASQIGLAEAALIVGVVPAPSEYSPFVNPEVARERQALVLRRMREVGMISQDEEENASAQPLKYAPRRKDPFVLKYPYFSTYVLHGLAKKYGEDVLYRGGLRVYTTLDPKLQDAAQQAVNRGIREAAGQNVSEAALVAMEPQTGYVKAMVGGTGWSEESQFNRAWQTQRPPGSSFKIFVYAAAMEAGFTPESVVPDVPVSFQMGPGDTWSPRNSDGRFMGSIPLKTALQYSRNTVSAQLVDRLTPSRVIDTAYKMGFTTHIDPLLSIALGAVSTSPLDMASALAVLANGGKRVEPTAVKLVLDADGKVIEDHQHPTANQVISPASALAMSEMMERAVSSGTGYAASIPGRPVAGKTGTTDEHRDAWFCGFVPQLAAAVWVGNDNNSKMYGTFGGDVPAPIWRYFMEAAMKGKPALHFGADSGGMVDVPMCAETGRRATGACARTEGKACRWDAVPGRFCEKHVFAGAATAQVAPTKKPEVVPTPEKTEEPAPEASATPVDETPSLEPESTPEPEATPIPEETPLPAPSPSVEEPTPTPEEPISTPTPILR